jgi:hypothetical protein
MIPQLDIANVALGGSMSHVVAGQVDELLEKYRKSKYQELSYLKLLIGANDVCSPLSETYPDFAATQASIEKALAKFAVLEQDRPARIHGVTVVNRVNLALSRAVASTTASFQI